MVTVTKEQIELVSPGGNFTTGKCVSSSNTLHWRYNDVIIRSDDDARRKKVYIHTTITTSGNISQELTAYNLMSPTTIECLEGSVQKLFYAIFVSKYMYTF